VQEVATYKIKCIEPTSVYFGKEREFRLLPLLPIVRRRLFEFFGKVLDDLDEKTIEAIRSKKIDNINMATVILQLSEYFAGKDDYKLEELVSLLICPVENGVMTYSPEETHGFLIENAEFDLTQRVIIDFFGSVSLANITRLYGMIYEHVLSMMNQIIRQ
jgi:hypothetical protein